MFAMYCRLNVSVSASNVDVIRKCHARIAKRHRKARKAYYRAMLAEHAKARSQYLYVMRGGL